jgi:hypothetical protein
MGKAEESRSPFKVLTGKPTERRPLEMLGLDGRAILERILKIQNSIRGIGPIRLRTEIGIPRDYWTAHVYATLNLRV